MAKFSKNVTTAQGYAKTPGRWLVEARETLVKSDGSVVPGCEIKATPEGYERWSLKLLVIDDHADAPHGAWIFDSLTFDGDAAKPENKKAEARAHALFKILGYPVEEWKKATVVPPDIAPSMIFGKPFVLACKTKIGEDGKEYLEPDGFMPFFKATAARGPSAARPASGGSSTSSLAGAGGPAKQPAATKKLPF